MLLYLPTSVVPILIVLLYSATAAVAAVFGALPLLFRDRLPRAWIGWSNALAAGLMSGLAYALTLEAGIATAAGTIGAVAGIATLAMMVLVRGALP